MRPHVLTIKAFGPFKNETVIDFDKMGNGVFLISGETGSGKTSVFDALMYALYGAASGSIREGLSSDKYYCDLCRSESPRPEMRVTLTFSNAGKDYKVVRRLYWGIKGLSDKSSREATLTSCNTTLASSTKIENKNDVTEKIIEILGLNADQFRRIVMLAQGEFQRFLEAKSDERGIILGRLYQNEQHRDMELRIQAAYRKLQDRARSTEDDIAYYVGDLRKPVILDKETEGCLLASHPDLMPAIDCMLAKMKQSESENKEVLERLKQELSQLGIAYGAAKEINQRIEEREKIREQLLTALLQKEKIEILQGKISLAKSAELILPFQENRDHTAKKQMVREANLERLRARLNAQQEDVERKKVKLDHTEAECKAESEKRTASLIRLQNVLGTYDVLSELEDASEKAAEKERNASQVVKSCEDKLKKIKDSQNALKEQLLGLESAGEAEMANAENIRKAAAERRAALNELQQKLVNLKELKVKGTKQYKAWKAAHEQWSKANAEYSQIYELYINGQSGVLRENLCEQINRNGFGICPVCGVKHTDINFCTSEDSTTAPPTREELQAAKSELDTAEELRKSAELNYEKTKKQYESDRENLLESAEKQLDIRAENLEGLQTSLSEQLPMAQRDMAAAEKLVETAKQRAESKKAANMAFQEGETALQTVENDKNQAIEKQQSASVAAAKAKEAWKAREDDLKGYPTTKAEAEKEINSLRKDLENFEKLAEGAKQALNIAAEQVNTLKGQITTEQKTLEQETEEAAKTAADFKEKLRVNNFTDEAAYTLALSPDGVLMDSGRLRSWITQRDREVKDYEDKVRDLKKGLETLTTATEGKEKTDLAGMDAEIAEKQAEQSELQEKQNELQSDLKRNLECREKIATRLVERDHYNRAFQQLKPMADAASNSYPFSRYVLTDFFRDIVEKANAHLITINGGEFLLKPQEDEEGRSSIHGLGLAVENTFTNTQRDKGTLSGGQRFETSLALALGLSDAVQLQHAGKVQIDSMFIDEGFGSLDGLRLDKAVSVLQGISGGNRQIGIISHVEQLNATLPRKICVKRDNENGSTVSYSVDV